MRKQAKMLASRQATNLETKLATERATKRTTALLALAATLVAGCTATGPARQAESSADTSATAAAAAPPVPVAPRPVVAPERGGEVLLAAIDLMKAGRLAEAEANLESVVQVRPEIAEAYFNLGWVKQRLNKHAEAIPHLEKGLQLKPTELRARNLIGISQRELGQFAAAETTYLNALAAAPGYDRLHLNLGILYDLYLFQPQRALEHYRQYQALQTTPDARVAGWIAVLERMEKK